MACSSCTVKHLGLSIGPKYQLGERAVIDGCGLTVAVLEPGMVDAANGLRSAVVVFPNVEQGRIGIKRKSRIGHVKWTAMEIEERPRECSEQNWSDVVNLNTI